MNGIYNIGLSSLVAYQEAINTTSQNIANATTPYYCRKSVNFAEGLFNNGVNISDVSRIYSLSASQAVMKSNSDFAKADTMLNSLKSFEPLLDNDSNNVSKYLNDTISSLQQLNVDASSLQGRSLFFNSLKNLSGQFGAVQNEISRQLSTANSALKTYAGDTTQILQGIASINKQIAGATVGEDLSALLDQQEQQVQKLATYFDFTTSVDSQGLLSISLSNGLPLVKGITASTVNTAVDPQNSTNQNLVINLGNGPSVPIDNYITSGQAAGVVSFRNTLAQTARDMGRLSLAITNAFNLQNKQGVDLNGNLGGDIFNDMNSGTMINTRAIANQANKGNAGMTVTISDMSQLTSSDYQLQFDTSSHYILTRSSDNSVVSSGNLGTLPCNVSVDGMSLSINTGTPTAGDQFTISPTANAINNMGLSITDPKLLALASPVIANANTQNTGDGTINLVGITDITNSTFSVPKQLSPPLQVKFITPTSYQLINANTQAVMEGPITYNPTDGANLFPTPGGYNPGFQVSLSGVVAAGDTFNLSYNANSTNDNRNGLQLIGLFQQNTLDKGTLNFQQAYRMLSGDVSTQANSAQIQYDSANNLQQQAQNNFNQVSGVSLEEESINLANYQQAYQASAQILQTAKTVFETIMGMLRS